MKKFCLFILFLFYCVSAFSENRALYEGEKIYTENGFPALTKFIKGNPKKPLIVFVPGDSHLARISYGYPGGRKKDFLSFWIVKEGYSFLGISYPLENAVYDKVYPTFSTHDWGKQIAAVAKKIIEENGLTSHIIILGWSMGGAVAEPVNMAAKNFGLDLDCFIALAGVPAIPYIMQSGSFNPTVELPNGLAERKALFPWFIQSLEAQNAYNKHVIIPSEIYQSEFIGNIPVNIIATSARYAPIKFIENTESELEDAGTFLFENYPWLVLIRDNSPTDAKISLIDPASWNFIRAEMLYRVYLEKRRYSQKEWLKVISLVDSLPSKLTKTIQGNHFFFIGERGAKKTVQEIVLLESKARKIKKELEGLGSDL